MGNHLDWASADNGGFGMFWRLRGRERLTLHVKATAAAVQDNINVYHANTLGTLLRENDPYGLPKKGLADFTNSVMARRA